VEERDEVQEIVDKFEMLTVRKEFEFLTPESIEINIVPKIEEIIRKSEGRLKNY